MSGIIFLQTIPFAVLRCVHKTVLLLVVFCSGIYVHGQTWEWKNPKAGSNFIYDIEYISGTNWIQGGEAGTIFTTSDDGVTWNQNLNPMGERAIKDIFVTAAGTIFVLGYGSEEEQTTRIIKSTDNGLNWSVIVTNNQSWNELWVFNDFVFVALVNGGALQKTTDGGVTFSDIILFGSSEHFTDIYFLNDSIGYASGLYGSVSKSTNGGDSWTIISSNPNTGFYSLWFTDVNTGYFGSNYGRILKTTDGGVSFSIYDQQNFDVYYTLRFVDSQTGYAVGLFGNCTRTSNGGITWVKENESVSQYYDFYTVAIKSPGVAMAAGAYGNIFKRQNTPEWQSLNTTELNSATSMDWATAERGFVTLSDGKMLATTNGGESWNRYILRDGIYTSRVIFANELQGTIFTSYDTLLYTDDGGISWFKKATPAGAYSIVGAHFPTSSVGYGVGYAGTVLKTINGGLTWSLIPMSAGVDLYDVFFTSVDTGFVTSVGVGTFRTTNGGISWTLIPGLEGVALGIDFPTKEIGYSIGATNYSFKTTDGGFNWFPIAFPNNNNYTVKFTSAETGYTGGAFGQIFKTTDGGNSWIPERDGLGTLDRVVYDLDIDPAGNLWAVSNFDGVHKKRAGLSIPTSANLIYPTNHQVNTLLILLLRWSPAALADHYEVQISTNALFTGELIEYISSTPYFQMVREDLEFGTTYFWRVRGVNLNGPGAYSTVFQFTTYNPPIVLGDVDLNGSIQAYDAGLVLKYTVSAVLFNKEKIRNANVTIDEFITPFDASVILQYTTGLISALPYGGVQMTNGRLIYDGTTTFSDGKYCVNFNVSDKSNIYSFLSEITSASPGFRIDSVLTLRQNTLFAEKLEANRHLGGLAGVTPIWESTAGPIVRVYVSTISGGSGLPSLKVKYRFNEMPEDSVFTGNITAVENENLPQTFGILGNYPNPFNPSTKINFTMVANGDVEVIIYDVLGNEVFRKHEENLAAGTHSIYFNGEGMPSGIYIAALRSGGLRVFHKMMLVK